MEAEKAPGDRVLTVLRPGSKGMGPVRERTSDSAVKLWESARHEKLAFKGESCEALKEALSRDVSWPRNEAYAATRDAFREFNLKAKKKGVGPYAIRVSGAGCSVTRSENSYPRSSR